LVLLILASNSATKKKTSPESKNKLYRRVLTSATICSKKEGLKYFLTKI
jgi:hypothetical protein